MLALEPPDEQDKGTDRKVSEDSLYIDARGQKV